MYLKLNKLLFTSYLFVGQMSEPRRQTDGGHFCGSFHVPLCFGFPKYVERSKKNSDSNASD